MFSNNLWTSLCRKFLTKNTNQRVYLHIYNQRQLVFTQKIHLSSLLTKKPEHLKVVSGLNIVKKRSNVTQSAPMPKRKNKYVNLNTK